MNKKIIFGISSLMLFVVMAFSAFAFGGNSGFDSFDTDSGWNCENDIEESGTYELDAFGCAFADSLNIYGSNVVIKGEGVSLPVKIYGKGVSIISGSYDSFIVEKEGEARIYNSKFIMGESKVKKGGKVMKMDKVELGDFVVDGEVYDFSNSDAYKLTVGNGGQFLMKSGKILIEVKVGGGGSYAEFEGGEIGSLNIIWGGTAGFSSGSTIYSGKVTVYGGGEFIMAGGETFGIDVDGGEIELIGGDVISYGIEFLKGYGKIWGSTKINNINIYSKGLEISGGDIGKLMIYSVGSVKINKYLGSTSIYSQTGNPDMIIGPYKLNPEKFGQVTLNSEPWHIWEYGDVSFGVEEDEKITTAAKTTFLNTLQSRLKNKIENDVLGESGCYSKPIKDFYVGKTPYFCHLMRCPTQFNGTACCGNGRKIYVDFDEFNVPNAESETDFLKKNINPLKAVVTCTKGSDRLKFSFNVPFDNNEKKSALWSSITS